MLKLLMTTRTALIGKHEASFWSDGKLELEEVTDTLDEGHVYERVCLDEIEQYHLLQVLLAKFGGQLP